ncbi:Formation of crista junctions protein 1 [Chytridiales sp. JEL 0842]|nr:Formation of crista junctions protein 1 [Chytridiales sp. JEL 0842]
MLGLRRIKHLRAGRRFATSASAPKRFPIVKVTLATVGLGAAAYTGAAVIALNNDDAKKLWVENVPGGETGLIAVDDGLKKVQSLTVKDIDETIKASTQSVEQTFNQVKQVSEKSYKTVVDTFDHAKQVTEKSFQSGTDTLAKAKETIQSTTEDAQRVLKSTSDSVLATYNDGIKMFEKTKETASEYTNKVFETVESLRESILGKTPKEEPPAIPPQSTIKKEAPIAAAPIKLSTPTSPVDVVSSQPTAVETAPVIKAVAPATTRPSTPSSTKPATPSTKEAQKVLDTAEPAKPSPSISTNESTEISKTEEKTPIKSSSEPPTAPPKLSPPKSEDSDKETTKSTDVPVVAAQEKAKLDVTTPKPDAPTPVDKKKKRRTDRPLDMAFVDEVDAVLLKQSDNLRTAEFSSIIHQLALSLVGVVGRSKDQDTLISAKKQLIELANQLQSIDDGTSETAQALKEQAEKFSEVLREHVERAQIDLLNKSIELNTKHREDMDELTIKFEEALHAEQVQKKLEMEKALDDELMKQAQELEKHWSKQVKVMVDEERSSRLARVDHLAMKLKMLERISLDAGDYGSNSLTLHQQKAALDQLLSVVGSGRRMPFVTELKALEAVSKKDPVVEAAINAIPEPVAYSGIATVEELENEFKKLARDIRRIQIMPEEGAGPVSYLVSNVLSNLIMQKRGLVPGEDIEAILARSEFYLANGDVESAAREINHLRGWPRKISDDWVKTARKHLEVKQALEVVDSHLNLSLLSLS